MTGPPLSPGSPLALDPPPDDRLESWKEIAAYMRRDVTTVQRWEKREGMPVHRHLHDKMGSVYASKAQLDEWARGRRPTMTSEPDAEPVSTSSLPAIPAAKSNRGRWGAWAAIAAAVLTALAVWPVRLPQSVPENLFENARFSRLTDFDGIEQGGAISRDGRFVAFLSDRDGQMDVWVMQLGFGESYNLTRGAVRDLTNPAVRTPGFSPDGTLVTFWVRRPDGSTSVSAVPVLGGQPRPYLEEAAEFDWSLDGTRLVYHTSGDGDPTYVREAGPSSEARLIFTAPRGLHAHFQLWSPDRDFIYFVLGSVPDPMDIWRIRPGGGTAERITHHESRVSHPVFWNSRTLLYLASDRDGAGPWIHSVDVDERVPRRVSSSVDRFTSLSASADGRRLVATLASPKSTLWRVPIVDRRADMSALSRIPMKTGNGSAPRLGPGALVYVVSGASGDSIWTLRGEAATEVWSTPDARVLGAPALAPDGQRMAFVIGLNGETLLYVATTDGSDIRVVTRSLDLHGAPAWKPDGQAITVAAVVDTVPRVHTVPLDGGTPTPLTQGYSVDPTWSPDGQFVAFSGPDVGTMFEVEAVKPDGSPYPLPRLTLTRGARRLGILPGRQLVVLRGEIRHKNLWLVGLDTGAEHQLTDFAPDVSVRNFDVSVDGREMVFEQVQEQSDIVLLEVREQGSPP